MPCMPAISRTRIPRTWLWTCRHALFIPLSLKLIRPALSLRNRFFYLLSCIFCEHRVLELRIARTSDEVDRMSHSKVWWNKPIACNGADRWFKQNTSPSSWSHHSTLWITSLYLLSCVSCMEAAYLWACFFMQWPSRHTMMNGVMRDGGCFVSRWGETSSLWPRSSCEMWIADSAGLLWLCQMKNAWIPCRHSWRMHAYVSRKGCRRSTMKMKTFGK